MKNYTIKDFKISGRLVGPSSPPFIIAELSGNHNNSLDRALEIVEACAKAGAHCLKLQTYTAHTMTIKSDAPEFNIRDPKSLWNGRSLYDLYEEASTPYEWHEPIFQRCRDLGMIPLSTPFDPTAVDFLESLNMPFYKIASFEAVDIPLVKKIASTGKPIVASVGMASLSEIDELVRAVRSQGNENLVLLKCTSSYPASPATSNIRTIPHLRDAFQVQTGLSDHTLGVGVAVASVALGATVIEKHVTLRRSDGGVDSAFSMEPHELKMLVEETERAWQSLGSVQYETQDEESTNKQFRRSLYICSDVREGEILNEKNVRAIRPGFGLPPKFLPLVLGRTAKKNLKMGTPLSWEIL